MIILKNIHIVRHAYRVESPDLIGIQSSRPKIKGFNPSLYNSNRPCLEGDANLSQESKQAYREESESLFYLRPTPCQQGKIIHQQRHVKQIISSFTIYFSCVGVHLNGNTTSSFLVFYLHEETTVKHILKEHMFHKTLSIHLGHIATPSSQATVHSPKLNQTELLRVDFEGLGNLPD